MFLEQEKQATHDMGNLGEELLKDKEKLEKSLEAAQADKDRQVRWHRFSTRGPREQLSILWVWGPQLETPRRLSLGPPIIHLGIHPENIWPFIGV